MAEFGLELKILCLPVGWGWQACDTWSSFSLHCWLGFSTVSPVPALSCRNCVSNLTASRSFWISLEKTFFVMLIILSSSTEHPVCLLPWLLIRKHLSYRMRTWWVRGTATSAPSTCCMCNQIQCKGSRHLGFMTPFKRSLFLLNHKTTDLFGWLFFLLVWFKFHNVEIDEY